MVPNVSAHLFIALLYWLRASVQGDVSEMIEFLFSQYSALGSKIIAVKLWNTVIFVLSTDITVHPMK